MRLIVVLQVAPRSARDAAEFVRALVARLGFGRTESVSNARSFPCAVNSGACCALRRFRTLHNSNAPEWRTLSIPYFALRCPYDVMRSLCSGGQNHRGRFSSIHAHCVLTSVCVAGRRSSLPSCRSILFDLDEKTFGASVISASEVRSDFSDGVCLKMPSCALLQLPLYAVPEPCRVAYYSQPDFHTRRDRK